MALIMEPMERIIRQLDGGGRPCVVCGNPARWRVRPATAPDSAAAAVCGRHSEQAPRDWSVFWAIAVAAGWGIGERWEQMIAAPPLTRTAAADDAEGTSRHRPRAPSSPTPADELRAAAGSDPAAPLQRDLRAAFQHARDRARRVPDAVRRHLES